MNPKVAIRFIAEAREAIRELRKVTGELKKVTAAQQKTKEKAEEIKKVSIESSKQWEAAGARMQRMWDRAALGAMAVGAALGYIGKQAASAFGEMELSVLTMQSFVGSAKRAREVYEDLLQFAATTPVAVEQIVRGTTNMLAFGQASLDTAKDVEELKEKLLLFGLAAKVTQLPGGMEQLIRAFADLRNQVIEIRQLSAVGISRPLLRMEGIKFEKGTGGLISSGEEAYQAALRILRRRFGVLAAEVDEALATRISNIADKMKIMFMRMGESLKEPIGRVIDFIVDAIKRVGDLVEKNKGAFGAMAAWIAGAFLPIWGPLVAGFKSFLTLAEWAPGVLRVLTAVVSTLTAAFLGLWVMQRVTILFNFLSKAVLGLSFAFKGAIALIQGGAGLNAALTLLAGSVNPLLLVLGGLALAVGGVAFAMSNMRKKTEDATSALREQQQEVTGARIAMEAAGDETDDLARRAKQVGDKAVVTSKGFRDVSKTAAEMAEKFPEAAREAGFLSTEMGIAYTETGTLVDSVGDLQDAIGRFTTILARRELKLLEDRIAELERIAKRTWDWTRQAEAILEKERLERQVEERKYEMGEGPLPLGYTPAGKVWAWDFATGQMVLVDKPKPPSTTPVEGGGGPARTKKETKQEELTEAEKAAKRALDAMAARNRAVNIATEKYRLGLLDNLGLMRERIRAEKDYVDSLIELLVGQKEGTALHDDLAKKLEAEVAHLDELEHALAALTETADKAAYSTREMLMARFTQWMEWQKWFDEHGKEQEYLAQSYFGAPGAIRRAAPPPEEGEGGEVKKEVDDFWKNFHETLIEGVMEISRSVASGDIARALERTFNTLQALIANKIMASVGGVKGVGLASLFTVVTGFIGKAFGIGKGRREAVPVRIENDYLNVRWRSEDMGFLIPPRAFLGGTVQIDLGGFTANFGGMTADEVSKEVARQVERGTRRSLTPVFG